MTTPDIAGLCERLKTLWLELSDAHAEPPATARIMNALHQSGNTLERQAAEIERLRGALEEALASLARIAHIHKQPGLATAHDAKEWAHSAAIVAMCGPKVGAARAALTGEDTAGSPTNQNTQPGLPFSDAGEP